jgi:hypothetical protein
VVRGAWRAGATFWNDVGRENTMREASQILQIIISVYLAVIVRTLLAVRNSTTHSQRKET